MLRTAPDMRGEFDGRLYHATTRGIAEELLAHGFRDAISYWGVEAVASYYAEVVADEDAQPAIVSVSLEDLDANMLRPDHPGIEEPLTHTLQTTEDQVHEAWTATPGGWRDCLDLIGSVTYHGPIPARLLRLES